MSRRTLALMLLLISALTPSLLAQSASGTINAVLINQGGIALIFNTDSSGVTLGNNGSSAVTMDFGNISAYGPLAPNVTRPSVTAANFTVRSVFDIDVSKGALPASPNYTLTANLAAAAPTGLSYRIAGIAMTTTAQTITTTGAYNTNTATNVDLVVSTAAPGSGGPALGSAITSTINFTATSN